MMYLDGVNACFETRAGGRDNVQRMDNARNVTQDGQQDVDEEVGIAATLKEDTERGQDDCEDDLDDVAGAMSVSAADARGWGASIPSGERHDGDLGSVESRVVWCGWSTW